MRKIYGVVAGAALAIGLAQGAQAAVVYEISGDAYGPIGLRYTSPSLITQTTEVFAADLDSCTANQEFGGACFKVLFRPLTTVDRLDIYFGGGNSSLGLIFAKGAFATPGFYRNGPFSLKVEDQGSAVPEPGAWALMIAGFSLSGAALRRRARARAA